MVTYGNYLSRSYHLVHLSPAGHGRPPSRCSAPAGAQSTRDLVRSKISRCPAMAASSQPKRNAWALEPRCPSVRWPSGPVAQGSLVDAAVLLLALVDRGEDHPLLTIVLSALKLGWFRYLHLLWPILIPWVFFRWFWPRFWLEWIMFLRKTYSLNNVCSPQKI